MKKKLLIISTLLLFASPSLTLASCYAQNQIINKNVDIKSSDLFDSTINLTAQHLIDVLRNPYLDYSLYTKIIDKIKVLSEISDIDADTSQIQDLKISSNKNPFCTVQFLFLTNNQTINVSIKNLLLVSQNLFTPPPLTSANGDVVYLCSQSDMDSLINTSFLDIQENMWRQNINSLYLSQNPGTQQLLIPDFGYVLRNTNMAELTPSSTSLTLVYGLDDIYRDIVTNPDLYIDIIVVVNLSQYAGKKLETNFTIEPSNISEFFGPNATFDSIYSSSQEEIYTALTKYVDSLNGIQPLYECRIIDESSNTFLSPFSLNNFSIQKNEFASPKIIEINFTSTPAPTNTSLYPDSTFSKTTLQYSFYVKINN